MKVIIAGTRYFNDYKLLHKYCNHILQNQQSVEIVSGCATGADRLGEKYALEKSYSLKKFPADWNNLDKAAGPIRNKEMAEYADALIAFWDGKSKGTLNMIETAKNLKLKVRVCRYE
ncbi:DUF2493 domain-containing protein [Chondrinema litorale]|uniref:DUF2493 domain-containing protein n=1 Tax=Chondrinema litorale TaxID=2994555 RepID=UPI002543CE35|nr:DUF2493 domain-containing protein [Chondrinema litorale]UZR93470.1 DUF2493 domain-containing protein [Chondrinema litorale]